VGALNNILTAHIEGGEVSGTIDELIRHAVTKLSHVHFVANEQAQQRLIQLGESEETIHIIGSPDIDIMNSENLPSLTTVREHYQIAYHNYAILIFHPVTTELDFLKYQVQIIVDSLIRSEKNYIVIYPNNDSGTHFIFDEYKRLENHPNFRLLPSIRFEYFLTLLKNADFIIGNSSAGIREAPHFGVPAINIGSRQNNRTQSQLVINSPVNFTEIASAIEKTYSYPRKPESTFGNGNSANHFTKIINTDNFLLSEKQKHFIDRKIKR
jgi:UDP-N-acetylglucosamine 2-epimerase (hydrolysing)